MDSHPLLTAAHNEVGFNVVLLEIDISFSTKSRFHIIIPIQVVQGGLGDMDTPEMMKTYFIWQEVANTCGTFEFGMEY